MAGDRVKWTAIVMTCPTEEWTRPLQKELELRQAKGYIDQDVFLLTVEDPKAGVGSGGATINALLTVAEYISAQRGYTVLNPAVLQDSRILILHNGRQYAYEPCGRLFTTLPAQYRDPDHDGLVTTIDLFLKMITDKVAVKSGPGIWVGSTDMILTIPENTEIPWVACDALAFTMPSTAKYCKDHGVYKLDSQGFVEDILFKESIENIQKCELPDGSVPMVCGLVYFSWAVSEKMLSFFTKPPLDACTYFGVDSGEPPIKLSLFFDVMLPMCSGVNDRAFRSGARSGSYGKNIAVGDIKTMRKARTILWDDLHSFKLKSCMIELGSCVYPQTIQEHRKFIIDRPFSECFPEKSLQWGNIVHSHVKIAEPVDESCVVINSVLEGQVTLGPHTIVTSSRLQGNIAVGKDCFIADLQADSQLSGDIKFSDSTIVQSFRIFIPTLAKSITVLTTHGRFDHIMMPTHKSLSSFCNDTWLVFLNRTGILREELWGQEVEPDDQTIYTARVFPVFHTTKNVGLEDIMWLQGAITDTDDKDILQKWRSSWRLSFKDIHDITDLKGEFESKRSMFYTVGQYDIAQALTQQENQGFRRLYNSAVVEGYSAQLLQTLDTVAEDSSTPLLAGVAARTLANIADVLGCMAGPKGGLRSGPAANTTWAKAFQLLEKGNIRAGILALGKERAQWMDRPDKLIRAARHYEGAAQILIRHAVMTAKQSFTLVDESLLPFGQWAVAECPARIDVAGGWSDTPPITYEHGGAVTTVALLINGKRPVGAKTRRIPEPKIVLALHGDSDIKEVICTETADLSDYFQPHSPGALLKAAFVCAEIVDLRSSQTLSEQLMSQYSGGFELHSWANLPHGSGMGTSSILAGAVMGSLLRAAGKSCTNDGLIHAVLYLEQLLTTGGGWQDQVGGLGGGIRLGTSEDRLPLVVTSTEVKVAPEVVKAFNERLVLIYTGKTRLARNLLQDVVRNWYARNPQIVETEDALVRLANECAKHFVEGDLLGVGQCMDQYWQMKKLMAPGCEPETVTSLMAGCQAYSCGMCMAGAGGGGFMYMLAKSGECRKNILNYIAQLDEREGIQVYESCVDMKGMDITIVNAAVNRDEAGAGDCNGDVKEKIQVGATIETKDAQAAADRDEGGAGDSSGEAGEKIENTATSETQDSQTAASNLSDSAEQASS